MAAILSRHQCVIYMLAVLQVITVSEDDCVNIPPGEYDLKVTYNGASDLQIQTLADKSTYCSQWIGHECNNADLVIDATHGWYSMAGEIQGYWGGNTGKG